MKTKTKARRRRLMLPASGYVKVTGEKVAKRIEVLARQVYFDLDVGGALVGVEVLK